MGFRSAELSARVYTKLIRSVTEGAQVIECTEHSCRAQRQNSQGDERFDQDGAVLAPRGAGDLMVVLRHGR